jgi:hypothetical protein
MHLTENVHYATVLAEPGKFVYDGTGDIYGYCSDHVDGKTVILRRTHPDVNWEDIAQLGRHLWTMRRARTGKMDGRSRR